MGEPVEWRGEGWRGEVVGRGEGCSLLKGEKALYGELWKLGVLVSVASMPTEGL